MDYVRVNYLIDCIMPKLQDGNAFMIVSLIARKTWGAEKRPEWVELSFGDISDITGIKSTNTIKSAISKSLEFINQEAIDGRNGYRYSMKPISNIDIAPSKIDISKNDTPSKNDIGLYQNLTGTVSNNDTATRPPLKEERKEKKEEQPPTPTLGDVYGRYENVISATMTQRLSQLIEAAVDDYSAQWVLDALDESAKANARSWKYVERILERWKAEGRNTSPHVNSTNGRQTSKTDIAQAVIQAVSSYGRQNGRKARDALGADWQIVEGMGGWGHVCSMDTKEIEIGVYRQLQGQTDERKHQRITT